MANLRANKIVGIGSTDAGVTFDGPISLNTQGYMYFPTGDTTNRGRGRAIFGGGSASPNEQDVMDYLHIQSSGNAIDFGNLTDSRNEVRACGSATRTVFAVLVSVLLKNAPDPPTVIIELAEGGVEPLSPKP